MVGDKHDKNFILSSWTINIVSCFPLLVFKKMLRSESADHWSFLQVQVSPRNKAASSALNPDLAGVVLLAITTMPLSTSHFRRTLFKATHAWQWRREWPLRRFTSHHGASGVTHHRFSDITKTTKNKKPSHIPAILKKALWPWGLPMGLETRSLRTAPPDQYEPHRWCYPGCHWQLIS